MLNTPFNAGLFLWIGDPRKQADFIEVSKSPRGRKSSEIIWSGEYKGLKMVPLFRKLDEKIFKKRNAANLLFHRMGRLHRIYLLRKKIPLLTKIIGKFTGFYRGMGPFPLTHPYFTYKKIDFHGTTTIREGRIFLPLRRLVPGVERRVEFGFSPWHLFVCTGVCSGNVPAEA